MVALAVAAAAPELLIPAQEAELDRLVERARREQGARTGIVVLDAADGRVLYHREALEAFVPASNMKVLTAAAALHGLGPDHRCRTRFALDGGVLTVTAGGDPEWRRGGASDPAVVLPRVVAALADQGVDAVRGVRLEQGPFTGPGRPPEWPEGQLTFAYCAPTGGLVVQDGCLELALAAAGGRVRPTLLAPPVDVSFRGAIGIKARGVWGFRDDRGDGSQIILFGHIDPKGLPATGTTAVRDPAPWFEATVRTALANGGIAVRADAPATDGEVLVHTAPWTAAIERALRDSSNFAAEQVLRVLGAETAGDGSLAGATKALEAQLRALVGGPGDLVVLADGSGLSRTNRVTPALLATTLRAVMAQPYAEVMHQALPLAGRTGSLANRFRGSAQEGLLRAKTGWIAGASSLSGMLPGPGDTTYVFSILMNYDRKAAGRNKHLKQLQEQMCAAIGNLR